MPDSERPRVDRRAAVDTTPSTTPNRLMTSHVASLDVRRVTRVLKALADETRLRIVALLTHGELCVCHIEAALDLSQPNASRAMSILRAADLVIARREGNWVHYSLAPQDDEASRRVLASLVKTFSAQDVLRKDVTKLLKVKGPISCG